MLNTMQKTEIGNKINIMIDIEWVIGFQHHITPRSSHHDTVQLVT